MTCEHRISVHQWRRRPPLRTKKLHIHWCWIKCTRCPHMRAVAIAPWVIRWGPDDWQEMLRRHGQDVARQHLLGAAATAAVLHADQRMAPVPRQRGTGEGGCCRGGRRMHGEGGASRRRLILIQPARVRQGAHLSYDSGSWGIAGQPWFGVAR